MNSDLRTFIIELAARKPNMRLYSLAQEIKKFETTQELKRKREEFNNAQPKPRFGIFSALGGLF